MKKRRVRMGHLHRVKNTQRRGNEAKEYIVTKLQDDDQDGKEFYALFTPRELNVALKRARKNPEDVYKTHPLLDWLD